MRHYPSSGFYLTSLSGLHVGNEQPVGQHPLAWHAVSISPASQSCGKITEPIGAQGRVYSFCITLMCCRRTAVAGSLNLSARSASSR
jgi:hypothetical protein